MSQNMVNAIKVPLKSSRNLGSKYKLFSTRQRRNKTDCHQSIDSKNMILLTNPKKSFSQFTNSVDFQDRVKHKKQKICSFFPFQSQTKPIYTRVSLPQQWPQYKQTRSHSRSKTASFHIKINTNQKRIDKTFLIDCLKKKRRGTEIQYNKAKYNKLSFSLNQNVEVCPWTTHNQERDYGEVGKGGIEETKQEIRLQIQVTLPHYRKKVDKF